MECLHYLSGALDSLATGLQQGPKMQRGPNPRNPCIETCVDMAELPSEDLSRSQEPEVGFEEVCRDGRLNIRHCAVLAQR